MIPSFNAVHQVEVEVFTINPDLDITYPAPATRLE
jgi:hypothetical protein